MAVVAVLVGSLRAESINRKLAHALAGLAPPPLQPRFVELGALPLYNDDLWRDPPAAVTAFKAEIAAADAVLLVTPEYNRGVPAVTKNAVDWGSRPFGSSVWGGKPCAICGASPGGIGTAVSQSQLRSSLVTLDVRLMGSPELYFQFKPGAIDDAHQVTDPKTRDFLAGWIGKFAAFVARELAAG